MVRPMSVGSARLHGSRKGFFVVMVSVNCGQADAGGAVNRVNAVTMRADHVAFFNRRGWIRRA